MGLPGPIFQWAPPKSAHLSKEINYVYKNIFKILNLLRHANDDNHKCEEAKK